MEAGRADSDHYKDGYVAALDKPEPGVEINEEIKLRIIAQTS